MDAPGADRAAALNRAAMLAAPPPITLAWLLTRLDAAKVVTLDVMRGGSTAAMHRVTVRRADGTRVTVVLRRYVAAGAPVPTPELLGADPHADDTDAPALVMSFLDGKPLWEPKRRRDWLDQLVDTLLAFHAIEIPEDVNLPTIRRYDQASYAPPKWAEQKRV